MLSKMCRKLNEENTRLLEENTRLTKRKVILQSEYVNLQIRNKEFEIECENLINENRQLKDENRYLLQRLKEMRHKTWFPVYEENLKLQEEIKGLRDHIHYIEKEDLKKFHDLVKYEKEVMQYKNVLESIEKFVGRFSNEKR
jgi:hypothetical protein